MDLYSREKEVNGFVYLFCFKTYCLMIQCVSIWESNVFGFSYQPSIGALGGILTMWDSLGVEVSSTMSFYHVLVIRSRFLRSDKSMFVGGNVFESRLNGDSLMLNYKNEKILFLYLGLVIEGDSRRKFLLYVARSY